jgi:hypothetical protein
MGVSVRSGLNWLWYKRIGLNSRCCVFCCFDLSTRFFESLYGFRDEGIKMVSGNLNAGFLTSYFRRLGDIGITTMTAQTHP